ncbi:outer membrane beta-barrel protein [Chitinophaga sp. Hz27]|uniref:outer membrane beta-barrel protein n=1 Tax=Chitinophaga sp. Hz27 TaxID=3347169 RepID=UPI0035DF2351
MRVKQLSRYIIVSAYLLFCCLTVAIAQTPSGSISGRIADEKKNPFPAATVLLKNDTVVYQHTMSDEKGNFFFKQVPAGNYSLYVSAIGYDSLIVPGIVMSDPGKEIVTGELQLSVSSRTLKGVTVQSKTPFMETQIDKTVVNLENSVSAATSSVMDMLRKLPGVRVTQDDQVLMYGRQVTVYVDGKATQLSAEALASLLKGMSASNVQKLELIPQTSAKYDAAGTGGIINIVKKKNRKEGVNGNVNAGLTLGQYGRSNAGINLSYRTKKFNFFVNDDYRFDKFFVNSTVISEFFDNNHTLNSRLVSDNKTVSTVLNNTVAGGVDWYVSPRTTVSLSGNALYNSFKRDGNSGTDEWNDSGIRKSRADFLNRFERALNNYSGSLHLQHQIDTTGQEITADLDYLTYRSDFHQHFSDTKKDTSGGLLSDLRTLMDQGGQLHIYSAKADYSKPLKGNASLAAGWKSSYITSDNDFDATDDNGVVSAHRYDRFLYKENINALYVNLNKDYKKVSLQLGLRAEHTWANGDQELSGIHIRRNYVQLFPSAFLNYKINDHHLLNFQFNRKTDRPSYADFNPVSVKINPTTWVQGNPDLQPVLSYNAALTYTFKEALSLTLKYSYSSGDFMTFASAPDSNNTTTLRKYNNDYSQYFDAIINYSKQLTPWWETNTTVDVYQQSYHGSFNGVTLSSPGLLSFYFDTNNTFPITDLLSTELSWRYEYRFEELNKTTDGRYILSFGIKRLLFNKRGAVSLVISDPLNDYHNRYVQNSLNVRQISDSRYDTRTAAVTFSYRFGSGKLKRVTTGNGAASEKSRSRNAN